MGMGSSTSRDVQDARALALEAASCIAEDNTQPDRVLAAMNPIEAFLLGGDTCDGPDLFARRRAVRRHLQNLRASAGSWNAVPADAADFVTAAWKYYDRLAAPEPRQETP